jgi:hypothetical protein
MSYYRRFIRDYSRIAAPLTDLTAKNKPDRLGWKKTHQEAFEELKYRQGRDNQVADYLSRAPDMAKISGVFVENAPSEEETSGIQTTEETTMTALVPETSFPQQHRSIAQTDVDVCRLKKGEMLGQPLPQQEVLTTPIIHDCSIIDFVSSEYYYFTYFV